MLINKLNNLNTLNALEHKSNIINNLPREVNMCARGMRSSYRLGWINVTLEDMLNTLRSEGSVRLHVNSETLEPIQPTDTYMATGYGDDGRSLPCDTIEMVFTDKEEIEAYIQSVSLNRAPNHDYTKFFNNDDKAISEIDSKNDEIINSDEGVVNMRKRWNNYLHMETLGGVNPYEIYKTKQFNKGVTMFDRENKNTQYWLGQLKVCNNLEWLGRIVNKAKSQGITLRSNINALNQAYKVTKARLEYRNAYQTSRFIANRKSYTYHPDTVEYKNVVGSF